MNCLGDVCEIIMGQAPNGETYNENGVGLPLIAGAGDFGLINPAPSRYTGAPTKVAVPGDIILCVRATIGDLNWLIKNCLGRGVAGIRPNKSKIDPGYAWWVLHTKADTLGRGATFKQINRADIEDLAIPLPPLHDQRRIAAVLDQADDLRRKRREALERLNQLYFATFVEMFGDPTANPRGWPTNICLGDVAEIVSGITKGRKLNGATTRCVPYLAVANVQDRALNLEIVKTIEATGSEIRRYRLVKNDLLLTEGGDPDKLGRGALWNDEIADCIHQNHIFRVRLAADVVAPVFINWLVSGPRGKAYFLKSAKQTTGIASINMTQLREFSLLLPPIDLQNAFAAQVAEVDKLAIKHRSQLAKLDTLFASLQHRAFRGEL